MHAAEAANYALIATIVLLAAHVVQLLIEKRRKRAPKVAKPTTQFLQDAAPVLIVFASVAAPARKLAKRLREALAKAGRASIVVDAAKPQLDPWDELLNGDSRDCAVLVSSPFMVVRRPRHQVGCWWRSWTTSPRTTGSAKD